MKEKFMRAALEEAKKAKLKDEVPIGCVIVKDEKIIAKGHNMRETKKNSLLHAEIVAINKACKKLNNFRLEDCELYVTVEPCIMCAGAIIQSRIKKVFFATPDEKYGAVVSVCHAFDIRSNHQVEFEQGILSTEAKDIIQSFFKELREKKKEMKKNLMEWKYVKTISESKLLETETKLGIKLSQELRGIILKYNNGRPEKNCFDIKTAKAVVFKKILSYDEEDKDNVYTFGDLIDKGYIPFAITEFGDVICESKELKVYLYRHESDNFEYVAEDITDFVYKKLYQ